MQGNGFGQFKVGVTLLPALLVFLFFQSILQSPQFQRNKMFDPSREVRKQSPILVKKRQIERGLLYLTNTSQLLPEFVGAKVNCTNCHLNGGKTPFAGPWINVSKRYPKYRHRTGKQVDLADRINDCFERSLNGKALPKKHPAMLAIIAYMESLNQTDEIEGVGVPQLVLSREPDLKKGEQVYQAKCVQCHQNTGRGQVLDTGLIVYPPLWGREAFNIAAGMARLHTAAGFVQHNMPLGQGGSLSNEEAWDVAYYFSQQSRPDYPGKAKDWPKGKKPKDARY